LVTAEKTPDGPCGVDRAAAPDPGWVGSLIIIAIGEMNRFSVLKKPMFFVVKLLLLGLVSEFMAGEIELELLVSNISATRVMGPRVVPFGGSVNLVPDLIRASGVTKSSRNIVEGSASGNGKALGYGEPVMDKNPFKRTPKEAGIGPDGRVLKLIIGDNAREIWIGFGRQVKILDSLSDFHANYL